ncbi:MAG: hypothetical protein RIN56_14660 [Sporomusaceae bacterium]|nr:hypothetical protein [Sporomusaceae bacterium]
MKKLLILLIALFFVHSPAFSAPQQPPAAQSGQTVQEQPVLSPAPAWPAKAAWVGQQATVVPAKLYASASYLLIFSEPGKDTSGIDQLFLARKHIGQTFTIQGLHKLTKKGAITQYFWKLTGKDGAVLWVRDYPDVELSGLPFALASEIEAENQAIAEINSLVGATLWIDRNFIPAGELTAKVSHLAPLTVTAFKSAGPFSEAYSLAFRQADGAPVVWTVAPTGVRAAFSNRQFFGMIRSGFMRHEPQTLFPHWTQEDWRLVRAQEIRVGWDREKVILSWGEPRTAPMLVPSGPEEDAYEWRYGKYYLYFRKNVLTKIKIPDPAAVNQKPGDKKSDKDALPKMIELQAAKKNEAGEPK